MSELTEEQKEALYLHFNQLVEEAVNKKHLLSIHCDFIYLQHRDVFTDAQLKEFTDKIVGRYLVI